MRTVELTVRFLTGPLAGIEHTAQVENNSPASVRMFHCLVGQIKNGVEIIRVEDLTP